MSFMYGTANATTAAALLLCAAITFSQTRQHNEVVDVRDPAYGAKGGARLITDAAIQQGAVMLEVAPAALSSADIGRIVEIPGAGDAGGKLITTIVGVKDATRVLLNAAANASVNFARVLVAADAFEPIQRAIAAAVQKHQPLYLPHDTYYTHSGWRINQSLTILGNGSQVIVSTGPGADTAHALHIESPIQSQLSFTGTLTSGTKTLKLPSTAGLSAGQ